MHGVGATLYYDGANLNAVMGISRPGDMGFDIVPLQPAQVVHAAPRRRRPGLRPDRRRPTDRAVPAAARRRAPRRLGQATARRVDVRPRLRPAEVDRPPARLPGQLRRASCAPTPTSARSAPPACARCSETAVLNANYLLARLREPASTESAARLRPALHARVRALRRADEAASSGIRTLDLAKRLLDYGFHPPTVYFPLMVEEALLVEPTETETRETLDEFAAGARRDPARGARRIPSWRETRPTRRRSAASTRLPRPKHPVLRQALEQRRRRSRAASADGERSRSERSARRLRRRRT